MAAPTSLFDAVIQVLRANSTVIEAFGDTYDTALTPQQNQAAGNVCKLWADEAGQIALPYLVLEEIGETYNLMSRNVIDGTPIRAFTAEGTGIARIHQAGRSAARTLGNLVCDALNDCDVAATIQWNAFYSTCTLKKWLMSQAAFVPDPKIGPGSPTMFNRMISFSYWYQGYMTIGQAI